MRKQNNRTFCAWATKAILLGNGICLAVLLLTGSGCGPPAKLPVPPAIAMGQALKYFNANVAAIPPFSAKIKHWKGRFLDEKGKAVKADGAGTKLYFYPPSGSSELARIYLRASTLIEKETLVLASNDKECWMYSKVADYGQWGKYAHQGKLCSRAMPFNPQTVLEFVGWRPLPNEGPYPVYRVNPEQYVLEYIGYENDRFYLNREIIIDRRSNLPLALKTYDKSGRVVMQSTLKNYQKLDDAFLPAYIKIDFPQEQSYLELKLKSFRVNHREKPQLFIRPDIDLKDFQQIDQDCENEKLP